MLRRWVREAYDFGPLMGNNNFIIKSVMVYRLKILARWFYG
jgi:hypothetical protein